MTDTNKTTRKGIILYKDYFNNEFEDLTNEQLGLLVRALHEYDEKGDLVQYKEEIHKDLLVKTVYKTLAKNNDRAVAEWNRKREYYAKKDKKKKGKIQKDYRQVEDEPIEVFFIKENESNLPTKNDIDERLQYYGKNNILTAMKQGNKEHWEKDLDTYLDEIDEEWENAWDDEE